MLVSYDGVAEARGRAFPVGEFNIQLNANQSWDTAGISLSGLQQKNFLNADFINAVESIKYTKHNGKNIGSAEKYNQQYQR